MQVFTDRDAIKAMAFAAQHGLEFWVQRLVRDLKRHYREAPIDDDPWSKPEEFVKWVDGKPLSDLLGQQLADWYGTWIDLLLRLAEESVGTGHNVYLDGLQGLLDLALNQGCDDQNQLRLRLWQLDGRFHLATLETAKQQCFDDVLVRR